MVLRKMIGIDLGVKDLVITSDGEKYSNQKVLEKHERRLKRIQRKLLRLYSKIKNIRKHYVNEIINKLTRENDIIVSEKLDNKEMSKNHHLSKSILDASFYQICLLLKWKMKQLGKYYYQVDTYYPSSKTCNRCGNKTEITNRLEIRKWECERCGMKHDRDINASINIMFERLRLHYSSMI